MSQPDNQSEAPKFEEALAELETIVGKLESGELGLDDAIAEYERGVKVLKSCQQILSAAERKIEVLSGTDADEQPIVDEFDDAASFDPDAIAKSDTPEKRDDLLF